MGDFKFNFSFDGREYDPYADQGAKRSTQKTNGAKSNSPNTNSGTSSASSSSSSSSPPESSSDSTQGSKETIHRVQADFASATSRQMVLTPYTSVRRPEDASDSSLYPVLAPDDGMSEDPAFVSPYALTTLNGRYVYLMAESKPLVDLPESLWRFGNLAKEQYLFDASAKSESELKDHKWYVHKLLIVDGYSYFEVDAPELWKHLDAGTLPPKPLSSSDSIQVKLLGIPTLWAFSSHYPLDADAILAIESSDWTQLFPSHAIGPSCSMWYVAPAPPRIGDPQPAIPVVDPLRILDGTAANFSLASDEYLFHIGCFQADKGHPSKTSGSLAYHKSRVAEYIKRIPDDLVTDSLAKTVRKRALEHIDIYNGDKKDPENPNAQGLRQLYERREATALDLIDWLQSEQLALVESCLARAVERTKDDSAQEPSALMARAELLESKLLALSRLAESERGKRYLMDCLDGLESRADAANLHEFVFVNASPPDLTVKVAQKSAKSVLTVWSKLVPLVLTRIGQDAGYYDVGGATISKVNEGLQRLIDQINAVLGGALFEITSTDVVQLKINVQGKLADLNVEMPRVGITKQALRGVLKNSKEIADLAKDCLKLIDSVTTMVSIYEAARDSKVDIKTVGDGLDLIKSLAFSDIAAIKTVRNRIFGATSEAAITKLGFKLTVVGAGLDIILSGVKATKAQNEGDYDAAGLNFLTGSLGALSAGAFLISGPAGWALLALSMAAGFAAISAKDEVYDKLVKFSPFGEAFERKTRDLVESDRAWTMAHSYKEWAPTQQGIETWFQAAAQLAYLFKVKALDQRGDSQGVTVVIEAQQLLPGTRLHIKYSASYPGAFPDGAQPSGNLWVVGLERDPALVDYGHFFKVEPGTVTLKDSTITLRLYPRTNATVSNVNGFRVDLASLILQVRLDVHGDGDPLQGGEEATLIVPTTKEGRKWVKAKVVEKRELSSEIAKSFHNDFLS